MFPFIPEYKFSDWSTNETVGESSTSKEDLPHGGRLEQQQNGRYRLFTPPRGCQRSGGKTFTTGSVTALQTTVKILVRWDHVHTHIIVGLKRPMNK